MRGVKKIGVCAFACILTPSPYGHSPYIPCRNTGGEVEMYSSFAFTPILYRTPRHAAGYGRGRGGLPQSLPLTGIIYPLRPAATSPIFGWAKHPAMLRDTVGGEEAYPSHYRLPVLSTPSVLRPPPLYFAGQNTPPCYGTRQGRRRIPPTKLRRDKTVQSDTFNPLPLLIADEIGGVPAGRGG